MNGMIVLIGYGLLAFIIGKMIFPSKGGKFGMLFQSGSNNFLSAGKTEEKVKTYDNKPVAQDPITSKNQGQNDSNNDQIDAGNTKIHSYADFNPDYIDTTDGRLNINLGENVIDRITLTGDGLNKNISDLEEKEKTIDNQNIEPLEKNDNYLTLQSNSETKQDNPINQEIENPGLINGYSSYIPDLREIKGPVKTMFIEKFTPPEGFKVEMLTAPENFHVENLIVGTKDIQNPGDEHQANYVEKEEKRKILKPKLMLPTGMTNEIMEKANVLEENSNSIKMANEEAQKVLEDLEGNDLTGLKDGETETLQEDNSDEKDNTMNEEESPKRHFVGNNQLELINSISRDLNNPENQMLSYPKIIKMNQITRQLLKEDKNSMLTKEGHPEYLNRQEVNELRQNEKMYASIYRTLQQFEMSGKENKKSIRDIANKVTTMRKEREEKASKEASKEVEDRMPEINKDAFYKTLSEGNVKIDSFIKYMDQFMDLQDIELSEEEKQKYREQARKNMEERENLSLEAIEEEYNKLYQKAKDTKLLDKIFSNNSKQIQEIVGDIINIPEIGVSVFGEDAYQGVVKNVDRISDEEYRHLYNKIKTGIMSELFDVENQQDENEDGKNRRKSHRDSYQEYIRRKGRIQNSNQDIMKALGIANEKVDDENARVITPINTYIPNVIDNRKKDDIKAV